MRDCLLQHLGDSQLKKLSAGTPPESEKLRRIAKEAYEGCLGRVNQVATGDHISGCDMVFIDTHAHLFGSKDGDFYRAAHIGLAKMEKSCFEKTIIMPFPFSPNQRGIFDVEDLVGPVRKYSNRFAFLGGGGTLNVLIHQTISDGYIKPEVRSQFEKSALKILSKGAIGFGEMAAEHWSLRPNHPYMSSPPDHPLFLLLANIAARHDVPIDLHMEAIPEEMPLPEELRSPPNPKVLRSNIAELERLLAYTRKAKIIWAHAGWDNTGFRTTTLLRELLEKHPNLYMSIKINKKRRVDRRIDQQTNQVR